MTKAAQRKLLLNWLVGKDKAAKILKGQKLEVQDIDYRKMQDSVADQCVKFDIIRNDCSSNRVINCLQQAVDLKRKTNSFVCGDCSNKIDERSIRCDSCLTQYHHQCEGIENLDKKPSTWFCKECTR